MRTLALLLAAAPIAPQDARVPVHAEVRREGLPPALVAMERRMLVRFREDEHSWLRVYANVDPSTQKVELEWRRCGDTSQPYRIRTRSSRIVFEGIPTALVGFGDGVLLVAGEAFDGHTVVERIELGEDSVDPETERPVPAEVTTRRVIYRSPERGHPVIAHFCGLAGRSGKEVTALTWDTSEVLAFDPAAGTFRVLASPAPSGAPGALYAPDLARTYHSISSRDHREKGYMLWLGTAMYDFSTDRDRVLVLVDGDRDGVFERSMLLDDEGWAREDLGNSKDYVR